MYSQRAKYPQQISGHSQTGGENSQNLWQTSPSNRGYCRSDLISKSKPSPTNKMAAQTYQSITNNYIVKAQLFFPFFFLSTSSIICAGVEGGESCFLSFWQSRSLLLNVGVTKLQSTNPFTQIQACEKSGYWPKLTSQWQLQ